MIEWWQALLISLAASTATGVFTWFASYSQSRWSAQTTKVSDQRRAAERLTEEARQARRDHRRQRVQPFYAFLAVARDQLTATDMKNLMEKTYESDMLGVKQKYTKEKFMDTMIKEVSSPSVVEFGSAMRSAMSSTDNERLIAAFHETVASLQTGVDPLRPYRAMQALEDALETYIVEGG